MAQDNPGKLAIVGELCWEGMYGGNCGPFVQRIQFWGAVLNGARATATARIRSGR